MLTIKSHSELKSPFNNLNISLGNKGLVFICGKKESSAKNLIKYIAGVEYLPGLNINIDGFELDSAEKLEDYRLYNIGYIFGNVQYIEHQTVLANVLSSSSLFAEVISDKYIDECLDKVGLLEYKTTNVNELSEYQLHCLDIARALMKDPKVLIANNPIARLSKEDADKIWDIIQKLSNEYLVVVGNALRAKAKDMAHTIISFEANEVNHVMIEEVEVIENIENVKAYEHVEKHYDKVNKFSFKNIFKISSSLLTGGIFVMLLFAVTIALFLFSSASTNNAHLNFAQSLHDQNVNKIIMMRNTEHEDKVISAKVRNELDKEFSELSIQWGYYMANDVAKDGYSAHARATGFNYPEALFKIANEDEEIYKLKYGSWDTSADGIYISESFALKYMNYINENYNSTKQHAKKLKDLYTLIYPTPVIFNSIDELVGEKLLLAFNTKNLTVLKISGIFEDNLYSDNLIIRENFTFPNLNPKGEEFDQEKFFSIGVVTLTDDIELNAKFLNYSATIIRDERESLIIQTSLDETYAGLYSKIAKLPTPLNIAAIIGVVLTVASVIIYFSLLIGNYRKELTISRTYGLDKKEIMKVSIVFNAIVSLISLVAGIIIAVLACVITSAIVKGTFAFVSFSYFVIPLYAFLIAVAAAIVFTGIFTVLSYEALKKSDYLVY